MYKTFKILVLGLITLSFIFMLNACVKTNSPPAISSVVIDPDIVDANGVTSVTVTATDLENDALSYDYTINGGSIIGEGPVVQWNAPPLAGTYELKVAVSDSKGGTATASGNLTVLQAPTQIVGTASLPTGSGDLSNAKASLFASHEDWLDDNFAKSALATGSGTSVNFTITDIEPGEYFLGVWKDHDNDGIWTVGDYVGWYGSGGLESPKLSKVIIQEGQTITVEVNMWAI